MVEVLSSPTPGVVGLKFPYDRYVVDWLRDNVPSYFKRWDPANKIWELQIFYAMMLVHFTYHAFGWNLGKNTTRAVALADVWQVGSNICRFEEIISKGDPDDIDSLILEYDTLSQAAGLTRNVGQDVFAPSSGVFPRFAAELTIGASKLYSTGAMEMKGAFGSTGYGVNKYFFTQKALWEWFNGGQGMKKGGISLDFDAPDAFGVFGLTAKCTEAELKAAYRDAVFQTHPDRGGDPSHFMAVREAYEKASNPTYKKRLALVANIAPLQQSIKKVNRPPVPKVLYHPPITYGTIEGRGLQTPGGIFVYEILSWSF